MAESKPTTSSGIYIIRCLKNNKVYVGSAIRFTIRWREHRWALAKGTHHSVLLQRAWNKYGAEAFEFVILENCPPDQLRSREQHYMDTLRSYEPAQGFNINRDSKTRLGMPTSEAAKAKISAFNKGKIVSQETRSRMSAASRGRKYSEEHRERCRNRKHSEETKAKMAAIAKRRKPTRTGAKLTDETKDKIAVAHARLSREQVERIMAMLADGLKPKAIADQIGCKPQTVYEIRWGTQYTCWTGLPRRYHPSQTKRPCSSRPASGPLIQQKLRFE